jgi:two-component system response regulator MtrA
VRALKLGADDYVTKPFWPEELVARVRARLRRPTMQAAERLEADGIRIDLAGHMAMRENRDLGLTPVEFGLLSLLLRRRGEAVSREVLVEKVLDPSRDGGERSLDVHMSRLRKKLGAGGPIETVWGIGYRWRGEP